MTDQQRIAMSCFIAWCVSVTFAIAIALTHGVELSTFLQKSETGRVNPWQSLVFSFTMSAFGFWVALTTKPRRIPQDPAAIAFNLMMYAKVGGWIFAIGGILVALRDIGLLQNQ